MAGPDYMSAWVQGSVNMMGMQNRENTPAWVWRWKEIRRIIWIVHKI